MDIKDAIIFSKKEIFCKTIAKTLEMRFGTPAENIYTTASSEKTVKLMVDHPNAILFLDWENGASSCVKVMRTDKEYFFVGFRPIFLVSPNINDEIYMMGKEFGVSMVHSGDLTYDQIVDGTNTAYSGIINDKKIILGMTNVAKLRGAGNFGQAHDVLVKLHSADSKNPSLICELADSFIVLKRYREAERVLQHLVKMDEEKNLRAWYLFGRCKMMQKKFDEAIDIFDDADTLNPHHFDRLVDIGNTYLNIGKTQIAEKSFDRAGSLDSEKTEPKVGKAKANLLMGKVNEALHIVRNMTSDREIASLFNISAIIAIRNKELKKGMDLYETAIKMLGNDKSNIARLFYNKGVGYRKNGNNIEALKCFEAAFQNDKNYVRASKYIEFIKDTPKRTAEAERSQPYFEQFQSKPSPEYDLADEDEELVEDLKKAS